MGLELSLLHIFYGPVLEFVIGFQHIVSSGCSDSEQNILVTFYFYESP
jgi:hypothetical protein